MELLIGCGSARDRRISIRGRTGWTELVTLDHNPDHKPDVVHDLEVLPYPFADDTFDEIHAYEVLEHIGRQGDWKAFFAQFSEFWRILKPAGALAATCPSYRSIWAWGDPSHTRVLTSGTLVFLSQDQYCQQVGKTTMSDFRFCYRADFEIARDQQKRPLMLENEDQFEFVIVAIKPSRWIAASEAAAEVSEENFLTMGGMLP
jgi:SAM-dependent methyltransferase